MAQRESREKKLSNICGSETHEDTQQKDIKMAAVADVLETQRSPVTPQLFVLRHIFTHAKYCNKRKECENDYDSSKQMDGGTKRETTSQHDISAEGDYMRQLKRSKSEDDDGTICSTARDDQHSQESPVSKPIIKAAGTPSIGHQHAEEYVRYESGDSNQDKDSSFSEMRNEWIKVQSFDLQGNGSGGKGTSSSGGSNSVSGAAAAAGGSGAQKS